jgi:hypothetical protein
MNIQDFVIVRAARIVTKVLEKNLEALWAKELYLEIHI